jgi:hypothetical protein
MKRSLLSILMLSILTTFASGCARGFEIATPDGFAELDDNDHYRYRATSAEGVVLAVRREKNEPEAGLDFWTKALDNELTGRGYNLVATDSVKSKNGTQGTRLRYTVTRNGRPNVLWVAVFVSGSRVVIVETGGDEAHWKSVEPKVTSAIEAIEVG